MPYRALEILWALDCSMDFYGQFFWSIYFLAQLDHCEVSQFSPKLRVLKSSNFLLLLPWPCLNYNHLLDSANPIARPAIPIAEIAVRILLTCGFWIKTADLSTLQIKIKYQEVETIGQRQPKIKIPQHNEKSFGTNSGIKATAKTAALTFVKLVISPNRKAAQGDRVKPYLLWSVDLSLQTT